MKNSKIWLSVPHMGGAEQIFIKDAFESNWITSGGENVDAFEESLENYLGGYHIAAVNSGTSALHLALILLGVAKDDLVLCQTLTFTASANPILYLGAEPIFIDSETVTWNMCPIALEEAIIENISKGQKPKCIIIVTLYGMPFQVEKIQAISNKYNIPILEDSAEALGSRYNGKLCGTFGEIGIFSFNGSKIITTSAGGALVCKSLEIKQKAIFLSTQAKDAAPHYQHSALGYNYRMSNICAAIGRGQMQILEEHLLLRKSIHEFYSTLFQSYDNIQLFENPDDNYDSNFWLNAVIFSSYAARENFRLALEQDNIETRPLWKPLHLQPLYQKYQYYGKQVAENLFNTGLCLPSSSNMTALESERIATIFETILKS
ncbi:DegT/DnrJ/EryC1/StrS family aminotransferase [Flavobacterium sp. TMP13]|uniref:DegT/DnrJ/EryC1/StrS family aminotransferase n=1 Tax=Flavobacterium sp. TMP13 TaxID=3425950 RepID=UPI003D7743A9